MDYERRRGAAWRRASRFDHATVTALPTTST